MRPSTCIASLALVLTTSHAALLRRQGACPDNSVNSLSSPFTLTGVHRQSDSSLNFVPLFSAPGVFDNSTTLTITSSSTPTFTLDSGILSTTDGIPCCLYQAVGAGNDAQVMCSSDTELQNPNTNALAGTMWATGTQCLDINTEIVVLIPVLDGMRHSKPFYVNEQTGGDGLLKYCVESCFDSGPLTSLRLKIEFVGSM